MTDLEMLRELVGQRCRCGNWKPENKSFCRKCYDKLSYPLQAGLYKRFGKGYQEAFTKALEALGYGEQQTLLMEETKEC